MRVNVVRFQIPNASPHSLLPTGQYPKTVKDLTAGLENPGNSSLSTSSGEICIDGVKLILKLVGVFALLLENVSWVNLKKPIGVTFSTGTWLVGPYPASVATVIPCFSASKRTPSRGE